MRRLLKILSITIGVIVCLLLIVSIVAPIIGRKYVVNHSKSLIGREISIDDIGLNLFTGSLSIEDFHLKESSSDSDFVSFEELDVQVKLLDLLRKRLTVKKIYLTDADVNVFQQGSIFNFSDIIDYLSSNDSINDNPDEKADSSNSNMIISLNDIRLIDCKIRYRDLSVGSDFRLDDVNLEIPALSFGGEKSSGGVQLNFEQGGSLLTNFKYTMDTSDFDLNLNLSKFNLRVLLPYLTPYVDVNEIKGDFSSNISLRGNLNHPLMTNVSGIVSIDSFAVFTRYEQNPIISLDHLGSDLVSTAVDSGLIHLKSIDLDNLIANVCVDKNGDMNLMKLMVPCEMDTSSVIVPETKETTDSSLNTLPPMRIEIDEIRLSNMNLNYSDASLPNSFDYSIGKVNVVAHHFSSNQTNSVEINGNVGSTGTLNCKWTGNTDNLPDMKLSLNLSNIDLKEFSPYCQKMFAYDLKSGNCSFVSENNIVRGYLNGINDLDVYKCSMEKDASIKKSEYNIPLKTALYIITDKDDHIDIDLPVKGNVNSPEFSYRKIIFKTFINLIVKVSTAPFSSIAGAMGLSGKDFSKMEFDASASDFTAEQYQTLNELSEMLKTKQDLILEIVQNVNYTDEIGKRALFLLKKEYSLRYNKDTDLMDDNLISSISNEDAGLVSYADSMKYEGKNISEKALILYRDAAISDVQIMTKNRSDKLNSYLIERKGLNAEQFKITTLPFEPDSEYNVSSRLEFQASLGTSISAH